MAASFGLTTQLKLTATWVEPLGQSNSTVTDSTRLTEAMTLENGSAANQANAYWKDQINVQQGTSAVDTAGLIHKAFGGIGTLAFAAVKAVAIFNRGPSQVTATFFGNTHSVAPGGMVFATAPLDGYATDGQSQITFTNANAASSSLDIYLIGVQST